MSFPQRITSSSSIQGVKKKRKWWKSKIINKTFSEKKKV